MKRLFIFLLFASVCFAKEYHFLPPHIPAPKIVEALPPDPQTHIFAALDVNNAFTGNNTHSGTETFTGLMQCKNFEQVRCVDSTNSAAWAGATADSWITAAIGDLSSTGGTILMPCGSYTLASAVAVITKPIIIQGQGYCTQLNYTPVTGIAFTYNVTNTPNDFQFSWGFRDLRLTGSGAGNSITGASIGGSSAAGGAFPLFDNVAIQLFGTGVTFGNNAFLILLRKSAFHHNGINIDYPSGLTNSGENIEIENCVISNATTIGLRRTGSAFFIIKGTSFDYNGTVSISDTAAVNNITLQGNYFENNNHSDFISTNSSITLQSNAFVDTAASGTTAEAITVSGAGSAVISGVSANASNGSTITQVLNFNSSGTIDFSGLTTGGLVTNGVTFGASARKGLTHDVKANAIFLDSATTYGDGLNMQQIILPNSTGGAFNWELRHQVSNQLDLINGGGVKQRTNSNGDHYLLGGLFLGTTTIGGASGKLQLANNTGTAVAGVTGSLFGWANPTVAWLGQVDTSGNMGIAGRLGMAEIAAPTGSANNDVCYGDSTAHALECSYNNGTFGVVPLLNRTQTWTAAQTYTGAAIIPDQTSGITGTTTNNNANAGSVGEYVQSVLATGSSVTLTSGVTANVTSISLTAGDWDVTGAVDFTFGATTSYTNLIGSVSSTSATIGGQDSKFDFETPAAVPTAGADAVFSVPVVRFSLSGTTTVFLVAQGTFTVSTLKAYGTIRARRVR